MGSFSNSFTRSFEPSFAQGVDSGSDVAKARIKAKLAEDAKDKDEERELQKKIKETTALAKEGFFDEYGINKEQALKLAKEGLDIDQMQKVGQSKRIAALQNQETDFQILSNFKRAKEEAAKSQMSLAPNETVQEAMSRQGVVSLEDTKKFLKQSIDISAKEATAEELAQLIKQRKQSQPGYREAKAEDVQDKILDIQEKTATFQAKLGDYQLDAAEKAKQQAEMPSPEEMAAAYELIEGKKGTGSKRLPGGLGNWKEPKRMLNALRDNLPLTETDKLLGGRAIQIRNLNGDPTTLLPKDRKPKDNEIEIIRRAYEVSRNEMLSKLGLSEKDIDKSDEGSFGKKFESNRPYLPRLFWSDD